MRRFILAAILVVCAPTFVFAQGNGKLQIHYMDVGQGDGAVLISPQGEVVLFDNGVLHQCGKPIGYLQSLGITKIDYHIASHYHSDHIGCTGAILGTFPLQKFAYDRGGSYTTATYTNYVNAVGTRRATATVGQVITLDSGTPHPVSITFKAMNGAGTSTTDENDRSLVALVKFGNFEAEFGGDLSGAGSGIADADPVTCSYAVAPTSHSAAATGGAVSVSVTTAAGCPWAATSNTPWLTVSAGNSGVASGSVMFSVASNSGSSRTGTATIAGVTVSVTQAAAFTPPPTGTNTCARPAGAPATATAVCKDGEYSSSQNRSGTCSHHGGVQCWICPGVLCSGLMTGEAMTQLPPSNAYADIESTVAPLVGQVEVYKVHHHGSRYSSNSNWLALTTPKVGIISVGSSNSYGHPTSEALNRLRTAGTISYWTSVGNGAAPAAGWDYIAGDVLVEVVPGASRFTVKSGAASHEYSTWGSALSTPAAPFGSFDTPAHGAAGITGALAVTGWALDDTGISKVDIVRDAHPADPAGAVVNGRVFVGTATFVRGARPDVGAIYANHADPQRAGWGYMLLTRGLVWDGQGPFNLYAIATDTQGHTSTLGVKTISVDNSVATKPFGNIDTPGQGGVVSGTFVNFGWVLALHGRDVPAANVQVAIDGVLLPQSSECLTSRADITQGFPTYDTSRAIRCFVIDSTRYANGVHTIGWLVIDSGGQAEGIGSRFFTVANSSVTTTDPDVD